MSRRIKHRNKSRNKAGAINERDIASKMVANLRELVYARHIVEFYTNLLFFKSALESTTQNIDFKISAKTELLRTIPEGQPAGAFLNRPGLIHNITELRTLLNDNFEYPQRFSEQYNHLIWLLNETITMVRRGLIEKQIDYPLIPQRGTRARSSPRDVMDLELLARGKRTRRRRRRMR